MDYMVKALDSETVRKIAHLARLTDNPTPEFLEKFGIELGAILTYVEQLQEIDTSKVQPTDGIRSISLDSLREDQPPTNWEEYNRIRDNIISQFPKKQGQLLELPGIFENN